MLYSQTIRRFRPLEMRHYLAQYKTVTISQHQECHKFVYYGATGQEGWVEYRNQTHLESYSHCSMELCSHWLGGNHAFHGHALTGEGNHHLTEWEGIMMSLRKGIMFPLSGRESSFYMLSLHCKESCSCWVGVNNATA